MSKEYGLVGGILLIPTFCILGVCNAAQHNTHGKP